MNPELELVDVIVFVDKSMTGAFDVIVFILEFDDPMTTVAVVEVGDGELDVALYGN